MCDHGRCPPPLRCSSPLTTWPSCADGHGRPSCQLCAQRARILLLAADGVANAQIAERVGVTRLRSSPAAAGISTAGWMDYPTGLDRVWGEYGIQPWRVGTFKFSTDPELAAKVHDVVGLYLHPPDRAVVLCVDEKSQLQALQRTQPDAPRVAGTP